MGVGEIDVTDDGKASQISCSICLDPLIDNGGRSWAKLQCDHLFHLDCIGSAFNFKGVMQCPNCRKIEKGQWLFASPTRSFPDLSMDDWVHDEDFYDLSYSEMSFGVQWCPFSGLTRMPSSFDEGDYSAVAYHDLVGQHAIYEASVTSSASHPCPYVAYMGPVHPSFSSSDGGVQDGGSSYNNHWNRASGPSEVAPSYAFPGMEVHYHNWEHQSLPFSSSSSRGGGAAQPSLPPLTHRQARPNSDVSRPGNSTRHFPAVHSSAARTGSSVISSGVPPHPGSVARTRDRVQALQAYFQPLSNAPPAHTPAISGSRRSGTQRGFSQAGPAALSSDQTEGFYYFPSASSSGRNIWETESQLLGSGVDSLGREYHNFSIWAPLNQRRHGSDRTQSQNR